MHFGSFAECDNEADVIFMIDTSGSIEYEAYPKIIDFVKAMAHEFNMNADRIHLGVMYFSDDATVWFNLKKTDVEDFNYAMDQLPYIGGKTNTANALSTMRKIVFDSQNGDRPDVPNYCILITDGIPNLSVDSTVQEAIQARIDGTHIVVVTVGKGLNQGRSYLNLHGIASEPVAQNFFNVPSFTMLKDLVPGVASALCNGKETPTSQFSYNIQNKYSKHVTFL